MFVLGYIDSNKVHKKSSIGCKYNKLFRFYFSTIKTENVNGKEKDVKSYTYEISDTVFVVDGSLYCMNEEGLELITYAGVNNDDVVVADDTVRVTAYAFAGSNAVRVKMPYTTTAIGHKAFFQCNALEMVTFGSHTVPNFEEEFDPAYYGSFENIPGSGDYGTYTDYNGNEVAIKGLSIIPFFMWNVTGEMYSNVLYGATFVDYVGKVENKLTMVRPVNGVGYDSFICNQYFDLRIDGPAAPDDTAVDAIKAIKAIPERVSYDDKPLVEAARTAYSKIATLEQQSLVTNYSDLVSAEQRIKALDPDAQKKDDNDTDSGKKSNTATWIIILAIIAVIVVAAILLIKKFKEPISRFTKPIFDKISAVCKPIIDKIAKKLKPIFDKISAFCKPIINKIVAFCKPIFEKIGKALNPICIKITAFVKVAALWVAGLAVKVFNICKEWIIKAYKAAKPVVIKWVKIAVKKIVALAKLISKKIVDFVKFVVSKIVSTIKNIKSKKQPEDKEETQENEREI